MKKKLTKLIVLLMITLFNFQKSNAQITLRHDYQNLNSPLIGNFQGIDFREAGFSGLYPIPNTNGTEFWVCSDRGVNIDCANANPAACRPTYDKLYAFPNYAPKIHRIQLIGNEIRILQTITIKRPDGKTATGIINPTSLGSTDREVPIIDTVQDCSRFTLKTTDKDTFGIDPEGIVVDKDGNFWLCEEGGATIWKLNSNGVLLKRYTPYANLPGVQTVDVQIDTVFKFRKNNRGFEGIAIAPNGKIYALIQSGILYPTQAVGEASRVHRILEIDPATNAQRMLAYLNEGIIGTGANQIRLRDWKIGDMFAVNDSTFLVLEAALRGTTDIKRLYSININQATPVTSGLYGGLTLEGLVDSAGLSANGIKPVTKTLVMDLLANGWPAALDKAEGLAILNDSTIAIGNDNDFGQSSPLQDGLATTTNNLSHILVYQLSGNDKLKNFKKPNEPFISQGGTGENSSQTPYLIPSISKLSFTSILTAGDSLQTGYKMVGIPDGTGSFDNGDGTFTLLVNHEIPAANAVVRAHGEKGAFVSKWVIQKDNLSVRSGSDLIQTVNLWNGSGFSTFNPSDTSSKKAFNRFCSADLPPISAFYNPNSGLGTRERIYMNGEEAGNEGRAFAHIVSGTNTGATYELPYLGKFSWENAMASHYASNKTIVAGTDDSTPGQVYFYVGNKTNVGTEIEKAGLHNGKLFGVLVAGMTTEENTNLPPNNTNFSLIDLGNIRDSTGAALNTLSNSLGVTNFLRPEDGAWDPSNPADFYFVTTNSFTSPSRLWRLRFTDINKPELGGKITNLLDGTEGQKMMDNLAIDHHGHIIIQEDPGNQTHLAKIWQYTIATDQMKEIAHHDPNRFISGGPNFLTQDEESSGVIDVQEILGPGQFLLVDQTHYSIAGEIYEGGQILSMFNPDTYNSALGTGPSSTQSPYLLPRQKGVQFNAIITAGDSLKNKYKMVGIPDGTGAFDNEDGTFTLLVNHEIPGSGGIVRAHGAKGAFVSKWIINKNNLSVISGSDLIKKVKLWNGKSYSTYNPADTASKKTFNRFCSADLPPVSAFFNSTTGLGTPERIYMTGEESGNEGRAFGHIVTGANASTSYELPYLGKFSWENAMASPYESDKTIVAGTDDSTPGQVYFYVGNKSINGTEIEKAGLQNGKLYGVAVAGLTAEVSTSIPPDNTIFSLKDLGFIRDSSGVSLNNLSNTLGVTNFLRPEDGAWDPSNANDFYFVTTNSFTNPSRLWRLRFTDINNPQFGGIITNLLDGTEGQKMMDNITIDQYGQILIQEDPGNQTHLAKIWQYTISTDQLKEIGHHDPARFILGATNFLTQDEESSGIIDAQEILGPGQFLLVDQTHYSIPGEIYEGGQILTMFNPDTYQASLGTSPSSSRSPYLLPSQDGVQFKSILTAGDSINSGYKMAGIPDGTGAYDNGDGTFTLLVNHKIPATGGVVRAHGEKGAFISKWTINKKDLSVISGSDLIKTVNLWNGNSFSTFNPSDTSSKKAFNRFCSADLPHGSAFFNANSGLGTKERIYMNGEEAGSEGRAFAHIVSGANAGTSYELPYLGKFSWENAIASPFESNKTIVAGTDDSTPGQVYFYIGNKSSVGSEIEKAGLHNGKVFGVAVAGMTTESSNNIAVSQSNFNLIDLGTVRDLSGATLNRLSNTSGVTNFLRPEDGAWDPSNPNDFYFVTTNSFTNPSRLWRLRFVDLNNPQLGGIITNLLDGTEGQKMMDNLTIDHFGNILIQEDPGNQIHLAKIWQYSIATDELKEIGHHDPNRFIAGGPNFLTQDEESSGIIDAQEILGPGQFLLVDQTHYSIAGGIYEGGQILSMFNPDSYGANPEIKITGNNIDIKDNDTTPDATDNTFFGSTNIGNSTNRIFEITNEGLGDLNISQFYFTGPNAADFTWVSNRSPIAQELSLGSTLHFTIIFTPSASGTRKATLHIVSNDFDESVFNFDIQGEALLTDVKHVPHNFDVLSLFPNPANENSTLFIKSKTNEQVEISLIDSQGKVTGEKLALNLVNGQQLIELPTAHLQEGLYVVKISSGKFVSQTKLIVIH